MQPILGWAAWRKAHALTLARLRWTAEWHVRDETYLSALAAIVDCHTAHPLASVWGPGDTSSSMDSSSGQAGAGSAGRS
jgi:TnpA family transposase